MIIRELWPFAKVEQLIEMFRSGLTSREIAKSMKVGRGSISGKVMRLREEGRLPKVEKRQAKPLPSRMNNLRKTPAPGEAAAPKAAPETKPTRAPPPLEHATFNGTGVTLVERRSSTCAFPVAGVGAETLFCGQKAGRSYCPAHHAIVYVPPAPRKRLTVPNTLRRFG